MSWSLVLIFSSFKREEDRLFLPNQTRGFLFFLFGRGWSKGAGLILSISKLVLNFYFGGDIGCRLEKSEGISLQNMIDWGKMHFNLQFSKIRKKCNLGGVIQFASNLKAGLRRAIVSKLVPAVVCCYIALFSIYRALCDLCVIVD